MGELYRVAGLIPLMITARLAGLFDNDVIDGFVDGVGQIDPRTWRAGSVSPNAARCRKTSLSLSRVGRRADRGFCHLFVRSMNSSYNQIVLSRADFQPAAGRGCGSLLDHGEKPGSAGGLLLSPPRPGALFSCRSTSRFDPSTADFQFEQDACLDSRA